MGAGREQRVDAADAGAEPVRERRQEPGPKRRRVVAGWQHPVDPLGLHRRHDVEVSGERHHRARRFPRVRDADLHPPVLRRQLSLGGFLEHGIEGHAPIFPHDRAKARRPVTWPSTGPR